MKTRLCILFFLFSIIFTAAAGGKPDAENKRLNEVVVYAYDSFTADWGPGPELVRLFEKKTGYTCTLVSVGDGAQVLSKAVLDKKSPRADVLVGIDNNQLDKAKKYDILQTYRPADADYLVPQNLQLDADWLLTPYDWSHFAFIYDTQSSVPPPQSLADLSKPIYAKKIILMDPRTSTPGLGFAAWTLAVYPSDYLDFWASLKPNILTMAPGWDTGYGLFTAGESPLVISYTTSPAYHVEYEGINRYHALSFAEGHIMQIEGAGLVKGAPNEKGGKVFLDFLISTEAQSILPLTQWMNPVNPAVALPDSYTAVPKVAKTLKVDSAALEKAIAAIMDLLAK